MARAQRELRSDSEVILELEDVSVTFTDNARVLNEVDFTVRRGETLGIVGESGSGKSMFASSLLNAVIEPGQVSGKVTYYPQEGDPIVVTNFSESELKNKVHWKELTFVVQSAQSAFNPTMSIRDHFIETLNAHDVNKKEGLKKAREICRDLYLNPDQVMPSYPHQLSGGMKQRALIALSVILDPEVLVLDEPTASLDLLMQRAITALLEEIKEKYDLTLVFVTHDLNLISVIADRLGVMYAFEFAEIGPTEEIVRHAAHPYTRMLLNSVPNISGSVDSMQGIAGHPPNPKDVPNGCRFHSRCPLADEQCQTVHPSIESVSADHGAACFYPEQARNEISMNVGKGNNE